MKLDDSLFVDGHLIDEVDTTFSIKDDRALFELVVSLDRWLKQHSKDMFSAYSSTVPGLIGNTVTTPSQGSTGEANQLLSDFDDIPPIFTRVIRGAIIENTHSLDNSLLNIEAMWSTLTAIFRRLEKKPKLLGHHIFLA